MVEPLRVVSIEEKRREGENVYTLFFRDLPCSQAQAGQYVMVWHPKAGEVPMSLSTIDHQGVSSVTIQNVGPTTALLCALEPGEKLGIRGPYGKGFKALGERPLMVAGGTGASALLPLVRLLKKRGSKPKFILGGRTRKNLIHTEELGDLLGDDLFISTDDGSMGYPGYASGYARILLDQQRFDHIYTCGPEPMMVKVFLDAERHQTPIQASLERYIKCAVGLCGSCAIGPFRVCRDGPVFDTRMLRLISSEFGIKRMDASGRWVNVDH